MWEFDHKEGWAPKNCCFWTVILKKTLESPLDCKEIKLVQPKGNQSWIFIGRTDAEAETPVLWPPDAKNWLIGKDPDAGKDWRQEEKGTTEDEMVGWHYRLDGHEFEQAPRVGDGQGTLVCCSLWGHKESDMTEQLNLMNNNMVSFMVILDQEWTNPRTVWWEESTKDWSLSRSWAQVKDKTSASWRAWRENPCLCLFFSLLSGLAWGQPYFWNIIVMWQQYFRHLKPWDMPFKTTMRYHYTSLNQLKIK